MFRIGEQIWKSGILQGGVCIAYTSLKYEHQDISIAIKQGNTKDEQSGFLWEMWRIISDIRPRVVVLTWIGA